MELDNLLDGTKVKGTSGRPARRKVPMRHVGADRLVLVTKRGNDCGAKGPGHSSHGQLGQLATGGTDWLLPRAAALHERHEPRDCRQTRTVL